MTVFVSVNCKTIVNSPCDRFRDGDRIFVCMTVIVIVNDFDRFLIDFFSSFLSSSLYVICEQLNWSD